MMQKYDLEYVTKMTREARHKSAWPSDKVGYPDKDIRSVCSRHSDMRVVLINEDRTQRLTGLERADSVHPRCCSNVTSRREPSTFGPRG